MPLRASFVLAVGLALTLPAAALSVPVVDRGWPVVSPGGEVLQGPQGGPVVSASFLATANDFVVAAHRKSGRRLWANVGVAGCGNCDGGDRTTLWPDGTYGPIGYTGDDWWAVDQDGKRTTGCTGVVLADATCIAFAGRLAGGALDFEPGVRATRDGAALWEYFETDHLWLPEFNVPQRVVRDGAGISYVSFEEGRAPGGAASPARLIALNPDGSLRWRLVDGGDPLAALGAGVVVKTATGVSAVNADGTIRWSVPLAAPRTAWALADVARGLVYVHDVRRRPTVLRALDTATGAQRWRTTATGLASVSRRGRVYVIDESKRVNAVRAISRDGRLRWRFRTAAPVRGAAEMRDGRVVVSTSTERFSSEFVSSTLLYRVNPRRAAPRVRRSRASLSRRNVRTACKVHGGTGMRYCSLDPGAGTILRLRLRRAAKVTITFRDVSTGRTIRNLIRTKIQVHAPAGRSWVRLLAGEGGRMPRGVNQAVVRWREGSRNRVVRLPFRAR